MLVRPGSSGGRKSEYLDPMLDRGVEPNTENIIVARELPAINDRALPAKSGRGGHQHQLIRFPELLGDQLNPHPADILGGNDFKNSRFVKAGKPQKRVQSGARLRPWNPCELTAPRHGNRIGRFLADGIRCESHNHCRWQSRDNEEEVKSGAFLKSGSGKSLRSRREIRIRTSEKSA